jgi:hypothetical protein
MRSDANKISLKAIRNLFSGARASELEVAGTRVTCTLSLAASVPWPEAVAGVTRAEDGPDWPRGVNVDCAWAEGRCRLVVDLFHWTGGEYLHDLCVRVRADSGNEVLFINVTNQLKEIEDGDRAKLKARFFITRRRSNLTTEIAEGLNLGLRDALQESRLPILSDNVAELCEVEVPSGELVPAPELAFRRLLHLALIKLDFIDPRGARERGKPLIDLTRWLTPEEIEAATAEGGQVRGAEAEEEDDDTMAEEAVVAPASAAGRQYWAGGYAKARRLEEFLAGNFWKIGWPPDSEDPAAQRTWKHFARIRPGDYFAIKGLGGSHDLKIRYVGEVVSIDADQGRLDLRRLDVPLYKGKAPTKRGAGNWHDTLVPIVRPDVVSMIFGASTGTLVGGAPPPPPPVDLPLNLIYYGPPGTGKTYQLAQNLKPRFQRVAAGGDVFDALRTISEELTWGHAVAVALHLLGGEADVDALVESPLLKAKYAAKPIQVTLRHRIWSVLGSHTIDGSQTVGNRRRFGDKLFNKRPGRGSKWFLAAELPEELAEIAKRVKAPATPAAPRPDHDFVTFHQAYGYEDFIEGIRPVVDDDTGDDEVSALSYRLEDGVFMQAVKAALALAGYQGTLDQLCALPREARKAQFANARQYALFIDEINRGNVARIFGELITLLEDDKRLGEELELIVTLPYSKRRFGVPPNLHVIGTMNTADRSIEALDTALRRRFEFVELPPRPELLAFTIDGGIEPEPMLRAINRRLEKLLDRDHCIGHAYFMELADEPTLDGLKRVFRNKVLPLLQEYFFGDWGKIGLVLGKDFVRKRDHSGETFADFDHEDSDALEAKPTWELADIASLSNVAFQRIYRRVADV